MPKEITWPAALGFLLGLLTIVLLQSSAAPGGERLEPAGMALILVAGSAGGALIGALFKYIFSDRGD